MFEKNSFLIDLDDLIVTTKTRELGSQQSNSFKIELNENAAPANLNCEKKIDSIQSSSKEKDIIKEPTEIKDESSLNYLTYRGCNIKWIF